MDGDGARLLRIGVEPLISRNDCFVADRRRRIGCVRRAIAVDDEPRIMLMNEGGIKAVCKPPAQLCYADVPCNVPEEVGFAKAEPTQSFRNRISRMIAQENEWRSAARIVHVHGRWIISR